MSTRNEPESGRQLVRIDLTVEQQQMVKAATSREAEAIELTVEELEQRVAPMFTRLAGNHNETMISG
jgi:hypothetical protein